MTTDIVLTSRDQISRFLPDALKIAIDSYHRFMKCDDLSDAKKFAAHHAACKAAIAHIELLLKFARWLDLPDPKAADHNNQIILAAMMQEAEDELSKYQDTDASEE